MLDRTTPWAVAFAFVLLVATAGAATQKAPLFATVGGGVDLAGSEAEAEADVSADVEVRAPAPLPVSALAKVGGSARGHAGDGGKSPPPSQPSSGSGGNGSQSPPAPSPTPAPGSGGGNGTGNGTWNGTGSTPPRPPANATPQKAPTLTPDVQKVTGNTRTTLHYELSVTNPDAKAQKVRLLVQDSPGWVSNISQVDLELEPGETKVVEGRSITFLSTGGPGTVKVHAYGADAHDDAMVHVCARGILVDLCEPVSVVAGELQRDHGSKNGSARPANETAPPANGSTPPTNQTAPPANQTSPPTNQTSPPTNQTSPPANETPPAPPTNSSSPPPPQTNQTGSSSPAPTPPPQNPPPPPPSNNTSTAPASPPTDEEDEGEGAWVHADVGAEGEASSDGLRVEV